MPAKKKKSNPTGVRARKTAKGDIVASNRAGRAAQGKAQTKRIHEALGHGGLRAGDTQIEGGRLAQQRGLHRLSDQDKLLAEQHGRMALERFRKRPKKKRN